MLTPDQFDRNLQRQTRELQAYVSHRFPGMAGQKILRFINGNFRAQGWQGNSFEKWEPNQRKGTILVKKGHLRRSMRQEITPGAVKTWSTSPYAAIHNRGFKGTINVPEHNRGTFKRVKTGTGKFTKSGKERMRTVKQQTGMIKVKAHTRKVNIKRRQFMPEKWDDSPVLVNAIQRTVVNDLKAIFE